MDHGHQRQRPPDLVPLQGADQVPADRQVGQGRGLLPKLLRPALAQFDASGRNQRTNHLGRYVLCHRDQRDVAGRAAAAAGGRRNPPANLGYVLGDSTATVSDMIVITTRSLASSP